MRKYGITTLTVVTISLLIAPWSVATQTNFSRSAQPTAIQYSYTWLDETRKPHQLTFTLDRDAIATLPTTQRSYQPAIAQRHVIVSLYHHARTYDPREVRVDIKPHGETIDITVASRFPEKIAEYQRDMREQEKAAFAEYLYKNYYEQYQTRFNENAIKPDHIRYIQESTRALIPLSQALYEQLDQQSDARNYINLLLGWIQSIPYSTLDDRIETNGSGFLPPITLLNQNKGDCDSKSVLAAAIIRAFLPNVPMKMVLLRDHALLAISLTVKGDDESLMIDGIPFVLLEPTGPLQLPLGQVGDTTLLAIQQGGYTTQTIPVLTLD